MQLWCSHCDAEFDTEKGAKRDDLCDMCNCGILLPTRLDKGSRAAIEADEPVVEQTEEERLEAMAEEAEENEVEEEETE